MLSLHYERSDIGVVNSELSASYKAPGLVTWISVDVFQVLFEYIGNTRISEVKEREQLEKGKACGASPFVVP